MQLSRSKNNKKTIQMKIHKILQIKLWYIIILTDKASYKGMHVGSIGRDGGVGCAKNGHTHIICNQT